MKYAVQWVRSLVFNFSMYVAMPTYALIYLPWAIVSPHGAVAACHAYCRYVKWTARWMVGLHSEVRGTPPTGEVLVAAKHQSFLDIIMIFDAIPHGKFIMKAILLYAPVLGQYAYRIGCIPVNRGKRGAAIAKMLADVEKGDKLPGQLVIYSQGTRLAPGVKRPYKIGTAVLYEQMGQTCYPVATNAGVFWPRRGVFRKPGVAVVEFLEPIAPGLPKEEFLAKLEAEVETASDRLLLEAGFQPKET
ncbi:lysophospholipid acyltransferase family protein [Litoreibacter janthinus]|uniref:1-acyl-sn-glycerol-3-phosphate acyltransferase n=1 Tax=Litoreibacter janthinus TaxID=670154 RepID=A0A1I6FQ63_9RHOB|nr:lysophospholipid acyltransferase family protein [Litoreibacter janthinus]SFR32083.1 1-acyl-sn-glycerol-3-phosphate acyltransferase [Litoreibacter janthinus]